MKTRKKKRHRFLAVLGVASFVILMWMLFSFRYYVNTMNAMNSNQVGEVKAQSPFDSDRAFAVLKTICDVGPRPSGSPGIEKVREIIRKNLTDTGLTVEEQRFTADTPVGPVPMVNLWAAVKGDKPGVILLGNHYESKTMPEITFLGANDSASTIAWMLEFARVTGPTRSGRSLWLCFFDGEESFKTWTKTDSLYGSRAFVKHLRANNLLKEVRTMINVDMIGDVYLAVKQDRDAPAWLNEAIWSTARTLNYTACFLPFAGSIQDDHVPFREAGIPSIDIIDFLFGKTEDEHTRNWHTERDTIDKVSADSLQVVGDVIYHALSPIEAHLDAAK